MQFLRSIKRGTLQVGIAPHKQSWATPRKKLSARILGYFIDRMSAARAHQTAHWNWLSKEASTKLRVGASEKMARRFFITGSVSSNRDDAENGGNRQTDWRDCARLQQSIDDHWR